MFLGGTVGAVEEDAAGGRRGRPRGRGAASHGRPGQSRMEAAGRFVTSVEAAGGFITSVEAAGGFITSVEAAGRFVTSVEAAGRFVTSVEAAGRFVTSVEAVVSMVDMFSVEAEQNNGIS